MSAAEAKETKTMSTQTIAPRLSMARLALVACVALGAWLTLGAQAFAAPAAKPAWKFVARSVPTNLAPGGSKGEIFVAATNIGGVPTSEPISFTDVVPVGLTPTEALFYSNEFTAPKGPPCQISGQEVSCTAPGPLSPAKRLEARIKVKVAEGASGDVVNAASIEGGGALPAFAQTTITLSPSPATFGFLGAEAGLSNPFTEADGTAASQAGSHPYELTTELGFPTAKPFESLIGAGRLRNATVDLPPGMIINPNATKVRCTEAQLTSGAGCPDASAIGVISIITVGAFIENAPAPLYNMVPPTGVASSFGFNVAGVGIFAHITGGVRSDGDYGLSGGSDDILALQFHPLFGVQVQFWGDPSDHAHDNMRGHCVYNAGVCSSEIEDLDTALLTTPVQCTGQPSMTIGHADSWENPGVFDHSSYASADLLGTPTSVNGCNQLSFEPTLEAKPTTNLADSPSGLDVKVHQPQNEDPEGLSTAIMKNVSLTLPEGMSVNPSSADGLSVCTEAQSHVHTLLPADCPDGSKVGTVETTTPLLDHPVSGALYLAKPFENPFGSLIALYLTVNDPITGVVANLAGKVVTDPVTGQITSIFEENPQLPIEDVKVHLYTGPRAALRTPPTCGTFSPSAHLSAWSAPETADATVTDSFAIQASPNGGTCPTDISQLLNSPTFTAGTIAPQAGAYSPFVLKLVRGDDTQAPEKIDTTLAPGLVGKLAGVTYCSEAQIAQALSRNKPNEGALEKASPSCPASSEVGTVDVGAGAGITPLYVQGHTYLAGPYKGAPLSLVIITPAVAGPFDLGAVVVRTALYLNSETAQIHAVSDPLPSILEGIPLDVRSIAVQMGRPQFTLNPTSCDPFAITGSALSTQGQSAALKAPFQVGGCNDLPFKPKLALSLKGATKRTGHPALTAVLTFKAGQANTRFAQVTLPRSEFLDQAHIGTVCTRVQFAADQCPAQSIYGKAKAITPLLDQPLEGPVYLRSSNHELPDLVIALRGQVNVELAGRVDSVNGGIRTTFEATPDAPVSKFTLQMQGGKKGLLINSANLCKLSPKQTRAKVLMEGQNGKAHDSEPVVKSACKKAKKKSRHHKGHHHR